MLTQEVMKKLQEPFPASEIKLKIQAKLKSDPSKAIIVAYIDARNVMERLDEAGVNWSDHYSTVILGGKDGIECTLFVDGVSRTDVGDPESDGMDNSLKSAYSDAFKRAAVKFGIGRFLYSLPKMYAKVDGNFIDKSELPRLRDVIDNHLANIAVGKVFSQSDEQPNKAEPIKERVFSIEALEEVIKAGVCDNHDDAKVILDHSVLAEDAPVKTIAMWVKKYADSGKDSIMECADVANQAYLKAKNAKKEVK